MKKDKLDCILIWDVDNYAAALTSKELDIYKSFSKNVVFASEISKTECYNILKDIKNKKILFTVSQYEVSKDCIEELNRISDMSEHNAFVIPKEATLKNIVFAESKITDKIKVPIVLITTKFPSLIAEIEPELDPIIMIKEWIRKCVPCGFNLIEAGRAIVYNKKNKKIENDEKLQILIYDDAMTTDCNGTSIHILGILSGFAQLNNTKYNIDVCTKLDNIISYKLKERYPFNFYTENEIEKKYDILFVPAHSFLITASFLSFIDRHALRIVVWPLDCILFRNNSDIKTNKFRYAYSRISDYVDGLVFLSNDAKSDYNCLFSDCDNLNTIVQKVIYIPTGVKNKKANITLPFDEYLLVMGNTHPHKMISQIIDRFRRLESTNFIIVGTQNDGRIADNIYGYRSGSLREDVMDALFSKCKMLIFPSVYEGFGLPVIEALKYGKDVIAVNRQLNKELESLSPNFKGHIHYYNSYNELDEIIINSRKSADVIPDNSYTITWYDVAKKLVTLFDKVIKKPIQIDRLRCRHKAFDCLQEFTNVTLESRYKTLRAIISADYSKISCDKVIDIYGSGFNGILFYKIAKNFFKIGCFVDTNPTSREEIDIPILSPKNYTLDDNHILVVTPEYDYANIMSVISDSNTVQVGNIIKVSNLCSFLANR